MAEPIMDRGEYVYQDGLKIILEITNHLPENPANFKRDITVARDRIHLRLLEGEGVNELLPVALDILREYFPLASEHGTLRTIHCSPDGLELTLGHRVTNKKLPKNQRRVTFITEKPIVLPLYYKNV